LAVSTPDKWQWQDVPRLPDLWLFLVLSGQSRSVSNYWSLLKMASGLLKYGRFEMDFFFNVSLPCKEDSQSHQILHWIWDFRELWVSAMAGTTSLLSPRLTGLPCSCSFGPTLVGVGAEDFFLTFLFCLSVSLCLLAVLSPLSWFLMLFLSFCLHNTVALTLLIHGVSRRNLLICHLILEVGPSSSPPPPFFLRWDFTM
jgi:hypothetical protein